MSVPDDPTMPPAPTTDPPPTEQTDSPPEVHENNVVAASQVETRTSRFEGDQDDINSLATFDLLERFLTLVIPHRAIVFGQLHMADSWTHIGRKQSHVFSGTVR